MSKNGIWLYVKGKEFFLPYQEYPWFEKATIAEIYDVTLPQPDHLRWEKLDVDLHLESLKSPEKFPLKYQILL